MKLSRHSQKLVINLKNAAKIISLHLPVDVQLPKTVWAEFQPADCHGAFKLFADKSFIGCMVYTAIVKVVKPQINW